jgi:hypothetical protein
VCTACPRSDGNGVRLKVRSLVELLPLAATTVLPGDLRERLPRFFEQAQWFLSLVNPDKLRRVLGCMQPTKPEVAQFAGSRGESG